MMVEPLRELFGEKVSRYGASGTGFDDLALVIYYHQAWFYNSPAETLFFKFEDAARDIGQVLNGDFGPFERVFLFIATGPGRVFQIPSTVPLADAP